MSKSKKTYFFRHILHLTSSLLCYFRNLSKHNVSRWVGSPLIPVFVIGIVVISF